MMKAGCEVTTSREVTMGVVRYSVFAKNVSLEPQRGDFEMAIRAHPLDSSPRLIYADWLDEHGHDAEALQHRKMGLVMSRDFPTYTGPVLRNSGQMGFKNPAFATTKARLGKPATPREASLTAYRNSLVPFMGGRYTTVKRAKSAAKLAQDHARTGLGAMEQHYLAARHFLQAAAEFEADPRLSRSATRVLTQLYHFASGADSRQQLRGIPSQFALPITGAAIGASQLAHDSPSHSYAASLHERARDENIAAHVQSGNYSGIHQPIAFWHHTLMEGHQAAAERNGDRNRFASLGHLIAAQVHRDAGPQPYPGQ